MFSCIFLFKNSSISLIQCKQYGWCISPAYIEKKCSRSPSPGFHYQDTSWCAKPKCHISPVDCFSANPICGITSTTSLKDLGQVEIFPAWSVLFVKAPPVLFREFQQVSHHQMTHIYGGMKQYKYMVVLGDLPFKMHCLGVWVGNDLCLMTRFRLCCQPCCYAQPFCLFVSFPLSSGYMTRGDTKQPETLDAVKNGCLVLAFFWRCFFFATILDVENGQAAPFPRKTF